MGNAAERAGRPDRRVFRSGVATAGGVVAVVVAVLLLVDAAVRAGIADALLLAPWILLALWIVYVVGFAPSVVTDAEGIRITNVLRVVDIPWGRVADIRLRWALEVRDLDGRWFRAWGGPVAGKPARPSLLRRDGPADPPGIRDVEVIRDEWEARRDDARTGAGVRARWDVPPLLALALLVVWAAAAVLLAGGLR